MKTLLIILLGVAFSFTSCEDPTDEIAPVGNASIVTSIIDLPVEPLSVAEKAALLFMREEEKLARDVYDFLYSIWSSEPFNNIASSELRHMDVMLALLNRYELEDPAADDLPGQFVNPDLQKLYDDLTKSGASSKEEALRVGAAIEEIDILDLQNELETNIDNEDIRLVFENLMMGSRNHLRAFVNNLTQIGVNYSPQYLTQVAYDEIINAAMEGGGALKGKKKGGN